MFDSPIDLKRPWFKFGQLFFNIKIKLVFFVDAFKYFGGLGFVACEYFKAKSVVIFIY
ncbi:hypothetical protein D3C71_1189400 [compost metagenome]